MKPITLLVGFDSAWTAHNSGALVGLLCFDEGISRELGPPQVANYKQAEEIISAWQAKWRPKVTLILVDQPTIVENREGQRPVENIVGSPVSRRRGGMQPASKSRKEMFGHEAPVWHFLELFGGAGDPLRPISETCVFETYPVLAIIALGWLLQDARPTGRLPKYNPRRNFNRADWEHLCGQASGEFQVRGLRQIETWINDIAKKARPNKRDQDCLDACLCLLVAMYLVERKDCLIVGDQQHGYIVVPFSDTLREELDERCLETALNPPDWVRKFKLNYPQL